MWVIKKKKKKNSDIIKLLLSYVRINILELEWSGLPNGDIYIYIDFVRGKKLKII